MADLLRRLRYRWRWIKHSGRELNRRVDVENVLLTVAAGKRPMLTREDCRRLAMYLGDPTRKMPVLDGVAAVEAPSTMPTDLAQRIAVALECGVMWTEGAEAHPRMQQALADFNAWRAGGVTTPLEGQKHGD